MKKITCLFEAVAIHRSGLTKIISGRLDYSMLKFRFREISNSALGTEPAMTTLKSRTSWIALDAERVQSAKRGRRLMLTKLEPDFANQVTAT